MDFDLNTFLQQGAIRIGDALSVSIVAGMRFERDTGVADAAKAERCASLQSLRLYAPMNFYWGYPRHTDCFRFHHGTILIGGLPNQECYFEYPIREIWGISFARLFIGIVRTDHTRDVREAPKDTKR